MFFPGCPVNCTKCEVNTDGDGDVECSECSSTYGLKADKKKCLGKSHQLMYHSGWFTSDLSYHTNVARVAVVRNVCMCPVYWLCQSNQLSTYFVHLLQCHLGCDTY